MYNFLLLPALHISIFESNFCVMSTFQESVISAVLKLCLKSLQEFVRLQTFNRSGFQQIQLDMEFLKNSLKEFIDDEAAISFLLKEVRYHLIQTILVVPLIRVNCRELYTTFVLC